MDEGTGSVFRLTGIVKNVKYPPVYGWGVLLPPPPVLLLLRGKAKPPALCRGLLLSVVLLGLSGSEDRRQRRTNFYHPIMYSYIRDTHGGG